MGEFLRRGCECCKISEMGHDDSPPAGITPVRTRQVVTATVVYSAFVIAIVLTLPLTSRLPNLTQPIPNSEGKASRPTPSDEPRPTASPTNGSPQLRKSDVAKLRTMPLLRANGPVAEAFPNGGGLEDPGAVRKVANRLAKEAGIQKAMPEVWKSIAGKEQEPFPKLRDENVGGSKVPYPYEYSGYGDLKKALASAELKRHTKPLLDLANLFVLAAPPAFHAHPFTFGAVPAQLISRAVSETSAGCDATLTQAWIVALGDEPAGKTLERLFGTAQRACKDDPTPRWVYGHRLIENSITETTDNSSPRSPIGFFSQWVKEDPHSPLAYAGLADAYIREAESSHDEGRQPFTVREYAQRARENYGLALTAAKVPEWVVGKAKAESILGLDDAMKTVEPIRHHRGLVVTGEVAAIYEAAHHFAAAVKTTRTPFEPIDRLALSYSAREYGHPAWLGTSKAKSHYLSDATLVGKGGATVEWLGVIPSYRTYDDAPAPHSIWANYRDVTCRRATLQRNLIAEGKFEQALKVDPGTCQDENVEHVARYELRGGTKTTRWDDIQNFWRYTGDLKRAGDVAAAWFRSTNEPLAVQRQGEIEFLRGNLPAAERLLQRATDKKLIRNPTGDQERAWLEDHRLEALTILGLTREKDGQLKAARSTYEQAAAGLRKWAEGEEVGRSSSCECEAFAETRLAKLAASTGGHGAALRHFQRAAWLVAKSGADWNSGAEFNDYAAALLDADRSPEVALRYAKMAVQADPESPVYLENLAQAQEAAGKAREAAASRAKVTARDRTAFQTLNNSGVHAAQTGRPAQARRNFEAALAARPHYATAWFNLGVLLRESWNPLDLTRSEASLAKAIRLDGTLRAESLDYLVDHSSYATGLDVSRPIDANWTFSKVSQDPSLGLTWLLVVIAIVRLLFVLGRDTVVGSLTSKMLSRDWQSRRQWSRWWNQLDRLTPLPIAIFVGTAIATWPYVTGGASGVLAALAMLALAGIFIAPRIAVRAKLRGWTPSLIIGTLGAASGFPVVPVPVDGNTNTPPRRRWIGTIALATIGVVAILMALATGTPAVRMLGVGAIAFVSTALLPLKPFDGAYITNKRAERFSAIGLLILSTSLAMGWA